MEENKKKIGIVGKGQFGQFMASHLGNFFYVRAFGREEKSEQDLESLDYLIFSVPLQNLEEVCIEIQNKIAEKTILIDVTSVKVEPLRILKQYFLNNQILGTHPMFGPQSGKNGIMGLQIVLSNVSVQEDKYLDIKNFLEISLKLKVIEKTAGQHDREVSFVQGLSHFIGAALANMQIQDFELQTESYKKLLELRNLVGDDSWELYKTIQNGNQLTKQVRAEFLKTLQELEEKLETENF